MGTIIAVVSGKGGVGKTTLTAGLGGAMARRGHKVLITDGDLGLRDLDLVIGKENDIVFDALDVWKKRCMTKDAIVPVVENLDFLPASQGVRWEDVGRKGYGRLLKKTAQLYDYVIVDAPAGIGRGNDAILRVASRLLVVTEPAWAALRDAQRVMQICREKRLFDYSIVLNRVGASLSTAELETAWATLGAESLGAILPYTDEVWRRGQDGRLYEAVDETFERLMIPLCEFCETGVSRTDTDIMREFKQVNTPETKKSEEAGGASRLLLRQRQSRWRRTHR